MVTVIGAPINNGANGVKWGYRQMEEKLKRDGRRGGKFEGKMLWEKREGEGLRMRNKKTNISKKDNLTRFLLKWQASQNKKK